MMMAWHYASSWCPLSAADRSPPHGDGLVAFGFIRELAARGHELHVAAERVDLRDAPAGERADARPERPRPGPAGRGWLHGRCAGLYRRLAAERPSTSSTSSTRSTWGSASPLAGTGAPLVLGPYVPDWLPACAPRAAEPGRAALKRSCCAPPSSGAPPPCCSPRRRRRKLAAVAGAAARARARPGIDAAPWVPARGDGAARTSCSSPTSRCARASTSLLDAFARLAPGCPSAAADRRRRAGGCEVRRRIALAACSSGSSCSATSSASRCCAACRPARLLPALLRRAVRHDRARGDGLRASRWWRPTQAACGTWSPTRAGGRWRRAMPRRLAMRLSSCSPTPSCGGRWARTTAASSRSATPGRASSTAWRSPTGRRFMRLGRVAWAARLTLDPNQDGVPLADRPSPARATGCASAGCGRSGATRGETSRLSRHDGHRRRASRARRPGAGGLPGGARRARWPDQSPRTACCRRTRSSSPPTTTSPLRDFERQVAPIGDRRPCLDRHPSGGAGRGRPWAEGA